MDFGKSVNYTIVSPTNATKTTIMRKFSAWGKSHKIAARLLIIFSFILLSILGIGSGVLLSGMEIELGSELIIACIVIYLITILIYPFKKQPGSRTSNWRYARQKTCDGILAAVTYLMLIYLGNQPGAFFNYGGSLYAATPMETIARDSGINQYKSISAFNKSLRDSEGKLLKWKERKKLLKQQVRAIKKAKDMSQGTKVMLIILSCLVAAGLMLLVLSLSCELSCAGSEAAAVIVGIGGLALVALLLVVAIRAILGKKKKKRAQPETDT